MKNCGIFYVLFYCATVAAETSAHTAQIHRRPSPRITPTGKVGETSANNGSAPVGQGGYYDETLQIVLGLGTPTQHLNLTFDNTAITSFVVASGVGRSDCWNQRASRDFYNYDASSTYKFIALTHADLSNPYSESAPGYCQNLPDTWYANDTMTIGSLSVSNTSFWVAGNSSGVLNPRWASDGILGMGPWVTTGQDPAPLTTQSLLSSIGGPSIVSVYLEDGNDGTGSITFGGYDPNCDWEWTYVYAEAQMPKNWTASIRSYKYGENHKVTTGALYAAFSANTAFMYVPYGLLLNITSTLHAKQDDAQGVYTVDCSEIATAPPLVIEFHGTDARTFVYTLTGEYYIQKLPRSDGQCTLMILEQNTQYDATFIMGHAFHRANCHLYDFEKSQMAFAIKTPALVTNPTLTTEPQWVTDTPASCAGYCVDLLFCSMLCDAQCCAPMMM